MAQAPQTRCRQYSLEAMSEAMQEYADEPLIVSKNVIYRDHSLLSHSADFTQAPKKLVLCLDGTGNTFNMQPFTNVLKLFRMLDKDSIQQICYYQPGIGVNFDTSSNSLTDGAFISSRLGGVLSQMDYLFAFSLKKHVIAAYNFLCRFYNQGDRIYLFGFRYVALVLQDSLPY